MDPFPASPDADPVTREGDPPPDGDGAEDSASAPAAAAATETTETEEKKKRIIRNPQPLLNPQKITGPRGVGVLPQVFKDFKHSGSGNEYADLDRVMRKMEHWAHRMYPKLPFEDVTDRIAVLGKKMAVKTYVKKMRLGMTDADGNADADDVGDAAAGLREVADASGEERSANKENLDAFDEVNRYGDDDGGGDHVNRYEDDENEDALMAEAMEEEQRRLDEQREMEELENIM